MAKAVLERVSFTKGSKVFAQGDQGERAYIVESGEVQIYAMKDGQRIVYGTVGKGGIFGEMALIDNKLRMATASALQATTLIVISRKMFQEKLAQADPFVRGLLNVFASNIRTMSGGSTPAKMPSEPTLQTAPALN